MWRFVLTFALARARLFVPLGSPVTPQEHLGQRFIQHEMASVSALPQGEILALAPVSPPRPSTIDSGTVLGATVAVAALAVAGKKIATRRAALVAGAGAAISTIARPAFADENDDAIARIVANNAAALEKERAASNSIDAKDAEKEAQNSKNLVGGVLVGSVVLSVPFYYKNVLRLFTKITSGGKDDGYGSYKD